MLTFTHTSLAIFLHKEADKKDKMLFVATDETHTKKTENMILLCMTIQTWQLMIKQDFTVKENTLFYVGGF